MPKKESKRFCNVKIGSTRIQSRAPKARNRQGGGGVRVAGGAFFSSPIPPTPTPRFRTGVRSLYYVKPYILTYMESARIREKYTAEQLHRRRATAHVQDIKFKIFISCFAWRAPAMIPSCSTVLIIKLLYLTWWKTTDVLSALWRRCTFHPRPLNTHSTVEAWWLPRASTTFCSTWLSKHWLVSMWPRWGRCTWHQFHVYVGYRSWTPWKYVWRHSLPLVSVRRHGDVNLVKIKVKFDLECELRCRSAQLRLRQMHWTNLQ